MKKEKLTARTGAKICAWFVLVIALAGLLWTGAGIRAVWTNDVYSAADSSILMERDYHRQAEDAAQSLLGFVLSENWDAAETFSANTSAAYQVVREDEALWRSVRFDEIEYIFWEDSITIRRTEAGKNIAYTVNVRLDSQFPVHDGYYWGMRQMNTLWNIRYSVYGFAALFLGLTAGSFIFLLCGAGHRAGREGVTPGPLYPLPFDVFSAGVLALAAMLGTILERKYHFGAHDLGTGLLVFLLLVIFAAWCASLAMRVKVGPIRKNLLIWQIGRLLMRVLRNLPLIWKTVLILAATQLFWAFALIASYHDRQVFAFVVLVKQGILCMLVLYAAWTLRRLQKGGEALAAGRLTYQTDTRYLLGDFRQHGENLNSIAQGMSRAVEERLRSERLKTELITNVSHDIKTPLTSIINYIDLLKNNTDPEKTAEYLEVLDRQSRRLKKLTEDLVEASKASTGNIEVKLTAQSAQELARQALGEYGERLEAAGLEAVMDDSGQECPVLADGTLMWRVLDNLLSNACKYAQPGTRLYLDVRPEGDKVRMSLKNISRERLNVSADELMERFVRGDSARTGEGSGLGLNIARDLMILQGGALQLTVDGDLFRADLILPKAG